MIDVLGHMQSVACYSHGGFGASGKELIWPSWFRRFEHIDQSVTNPNPAFYNLEDLYPPVRTPHGNPKTRTRQCPVHAKGL